MNISEILKKYEAYRDSYYLVGEAKDPYQLHKEWCWAVMDGHKNGDLPAEWEFFKPPYRYLRSNWKTKIKNNYIGFSLSICPEIWYQVVHEILLHINSICPNFQIEFVGLRNGGCKFDLLNITDEIKEELIEAEYNLWDYHLLK